MTILEYLPHLFGDIKADDAYWGGVKQRWIRGRVEKNKTPFVAAVEKRKVNPNVSH